MASPPRSPGPARGSPPRLRTPIAITPPVPLLSPASSSKVLGVIRPPSVEVQPEALRSASSLQSSQTAVVENQGSSVSVSGGLKRDVSPAITAQRGYAASMGRAIHGIASNGSSTVTERTEEIIIQPGKIHHHLEALVGKAVFEHNSDLDPETRAETRRDE